MRIFGALLFAILVTAGVLGVPLWWSNAVVDVSALARGDELSLSQRFIGDLRSKNYTDALAILEPASRPKDTAILSQLTAIFPKRHEDAVRVSTWRKMSLSNGTTTTQIEMFYDFGKGGAVRGQFTTFQDATGSLKIHGVRIDAYTVQQLHGNDFRLPATPWDIRWAFLATAAVFDIFAFATFALCLLSPVVRWRWRWLWLIAVLAGGVRFNIDWAALQFNYQLIAFIVPPAQFSAFAAYGSWVLVLSAPLGAMIYWARRAQWRTEANTRGTPTAA